MKDDQRLSVGDVIANRYVIERHLGVSTAANLYIANENYSSQRICVKVYSRQISSTLFNASNFFLRASTLTQLSHDNLAQCFEIQEEMGRVFVVREMVEGQDFEAWIQANKKQSYYFSKGLEILWQVCQGLAEIHQRGKHLNIHPGNIIVGPLVSKFCDWDPRSIAGVDIQEGLPLIPDFYGYRAPETRIRGQLSYPNSDLYSVASLVYRLIKGEHPSEDPAELQRTINALPAPVVLFLSKALHPSPEKRIQDTENFADSLWQLSETLKDIGPGEQSQTSISSPVVAPKSITATLFSSLADEDKSKILSPEKKTGGAENSFARDEMTFDDPPNSNSDSQLESGSAFHFSLEEESPSAHMPLRESKPGGKTLFKSRQSSLSAEKKTSGSLLAALEEENFNQTRNDTDSSSYTLFGFKGMSGNNTGSFQKPPPDRNQGRFKLMLILSAVVSILVLLAALLFFLAPKAKEDFAQSKVANEISRKESIEPEASAPTRVEATSTTEVSEAHPDKLGTGENYVEKLLEEPLKKPEAPQSSPIEKPGSSPLSKVDEWPASAAECLKKADELNDWGKTAEANTAYNRALTYTNIAPKQTIQALGGLAVTYHKLGEKSKALAALDQILKLNPGNKFAQGYRTKME